MKKRVFRPSSVSDALGGDPIRGPAVCELIEERGRSHEASARAAGACGVVEQVLAKVNEAIASSEAVLKRCEIDELERDDWQVLRDVLEGVKTDLVDYLAPRPPLATLRQEKAPCDERPEKPTGPANDQRTP